MPKDNRYPVIGLTGGVGAGKSTVLSFLQEKYGFYVIQADLTARSLMEPGKDAYKAVCAFLGPVILQENGQIDRKVMADIMKIAMIAVDRELRKRGLSSRIVLQIHDELLIETAENEVDEVKEILTDKMKHAANLKVSLEVDAKTGASWFDAK